ncbi:unnamed protein product, partial [marine sediment metagenome]
MTSPKKTKTKKKVSVQKVLVIGIAIVSLAVVIFAFWTGRLMRARKAKESQNQINIVQNSNTQTNMLPITNSNVNQSPTNTSGPTNSNVNQSLTHEVQKTEDVQYLDNCEDCLLDIYNKDDGTNNKPIIIFVHGGEGRIPA